MADRYKGITLTIEGDSTPLQKALKEPQAEARTLEANLKKVNEMLKLDPTNTELVTQKQKLLGDAVAVNKEKLQLLKQAQQEFINNGGDITSTEYINLQQEIQKTEQKLKKLTDETKSFSDICNEVGQGLQATGEGLQKAGEKTKFLTDAVKELGEASVDAWKQIDKAYDTIAAGTGATGDALNSLKNNFDNVYSNFPAESEDVADALANINTLFGYQGEKLEDTTTDFLKFARVNNTNAGQSVTKVYQAMQKLGVETSSYGSFLDQLTTASQVSGISFDNLSGELTSYGTILGGLGFTTEQSISLLASFEKNGINVSQAVTGMKTAFQNWAKEGKNANQEFENTINAIKTSNSDIEATSIAMEVFGDRAGPELANSIRKGTFELDDLIDTISDAGGQVDATYNEIKDPFDDIQEVMNSITTAGKELASAGLEVLGPIIEDVIGCIKDAVEWFKNLDPEVKDMIVKALLIVAAISPVLSIVGTILVKMGLLITFLPTIGSALSGLWTTLSTSPIGWIIGLIAVLVGAFVTLWNTSEDFRDSILGTWEKLKAAFQDFVDGLTERLNDLGIDWEDIINAIKTYWQMLCDFLAPIFEGAWVMIVDVLSGFFDIILGLIDFFTGLFTGDWDKCWQGIQEIFSGILKIIEGAIENWFINIKGFFENIAKWIGFSWEDIWNNVKNCFNGFVEWFQNCVDGFISFFTETIPNAIDWLSNHITEIIGFLIAFLNNPFQAVKNLLEKYFPEQLEAFKKFLSDKWNGFLRWLSVDVPKFFSDLWNKIINFFKNLPSNIWNWLLKVIEKMQNWGTQAKTSIKNTCNTLWDNLCSFFKSLPGNALQWGKDMISGFIDGIKAMFTNFTNTIGDIAGYVASYLHFSVPDEGPLADFDESGADMVDLFIDGINRKKTALEEAVQGMAQTLSGASDFNQTIAQTNNQTINIPVELNLDGKVITKNVVQRITKENRSLRLAKGGI